MDARRLRIEVTAIIRHERLREGTCGNGARKIHTAAQMPLSAFKALKKLCNFKSEDS